jgi:hypothetical protein
VLGVLVVAPPAKQPSRAVFWSLLELGILLFILFGVWIGAANAIHIAIFGDVLNRAALGSKAAPRLYGLPLATITG